MSSQNPIDIFTRKSVESAAEVKAPTPATLFNIENDDKEIDTNPKRRNVGTIIGVVGLVGLAATAIATYKMAEDAGSQETTSSSSNQPEHEQLKPRIITINPGETLSGEVAEILKKRADEQAFSEEPTGEEIFDTTVSIAHVNGIENPDKVYAGEQFVVPQRIMPAITVTPEG
jgi:hypothetical protein